MMVQKMLLKLTKTSARVLFQKLLLIVTEKGWIFFVKSEEKVVTKISVHFGGADVVHMWNDLFRKWLVAGWLLENVMQTSFPDEHTFELHDYHRVSLLVRRKCPRLQWINEKREKRFFAGASKYGCISFARFSFCVYVEMSSFPCFCIKYWISSKNLKEATSTVLDIA